MPEVLEWTWPAREGARAQRRVELAEGGAVRGRAGRGARRARRRRMGGRGRPRPGRRRRGRARAAGASCRTTSTSVGHRIVHGGPRFHAPAPLTDEVKAAVRVAERARAAAQRGGARGRRGGGGAVRGRRAGRGVRHRVPRRPRAGRAHLRRPARVGRARAAPLRLPRDQPRVRGAPRRAPARPAARRAAADHLPPRLGLLAGGDPRRPQRRHDDGLHAARGRGDGHALGLARPRAAPAPAARGGRVGRRARRASCTTAPACAGSRASPATCARCSPRATAATSARALAFDVYVHRLRFHLGAMLGALGGLDAVVFTAGVGEHSAEVRAAALEPFAFLGLALDRRAQRRPAARLRRRGAAARRCASWSLAHRRSGRSPAPPPA